MTMLMSTIDFFRFEILRVSFGRSHALSNHFACFDHQMGTTYCKSKKSAIQAKPVKIVVHSGDFEPNWFEDFVAGATEVDAAKITLQELEQKLRTDVLKDPEPVVSPNSIYGACAWTREPILTFLDPIQQTHDEEVHIIGGSNHDTSLPLIKALRSNLVKEEHVWLRYRTRFVCHNPTSVDLPRIKEAEQKFARESKDLKEWDDWYQNGGGNGPMPSCVLDVVRGGWGGPMLQPIFEWTPNKDMYLAHAKNRLAELQASQLKRYG